MDAFFDPRQLKHNPAGYFRRGTVVPHPEQPERASLLEVALTEAGHHIRPPTDYGDAPLRAVHCAAYVDFLRGAWERWRDATGGEHPAVPNYHPGRRLHRMPDDVFGQLGYFSTDTACPIVSGTWEAIYWSAQCALSAAHAVLAGADVAYGLCRPPGHHASVDASNGFCFLNNAAIAAQAAVAARGRVAILDIDTHAGNGTQEIFYPRNDVFFASVHVDPAVYPPYFVGYPDEIGTGDGAGYTLNTILSPGDGDAQAIAAVERSLGAIASFEPEVLVVSLGFDMAAADPLSLVEVTGEGFAGMAAAIAATGWPTILVQEGGYLGPTLSDNAVRFLSHFR